MSIWSSNTCFLPLDYSSRLDKVSYLKKKKKKKVETINANNTLEKKKGKQNKNKKSVGGTTDEQRTVGLEQKSLSQRNLVAVRR